MAAFTSANKFAKLIAWFVNASVIELGAAYPVGVF